jgi:hypothetical protein
MFVPVHTMKAYVEVEVQRLLLVTATPDRNKGSTLPSCRFSATARTRQYPLDRRLGGCLAPVGSIEQEKNLLPLPGIESRFLGRTASGLLNLIRYYYYLFIYLFSSEPVRPALLRCVPCTFADIKLHLKRYNVNL